MVMALFKPVLLLSASLLVMSPVADAVGLCNGTTFNNTMKNNGCPSNVLRTLYAMGSQLTYRVMPAARARLIKCATATISEPDRNLVTVTNTYSYNDISIADTTVKYNLADSECGLVFKYNFDNSYEMYKQAFVSFNSVAVGYLECTSEPGYFTEGELTAVCLTPQVDSEEVTSAAEACRQALSAVTGATDLVLVPHCTNAQESTGVLVDIAQTVTGLFQPGGIVDIVEDEG